MGYWNNNGRWPANLECAFLHTTIAAHAGPTPPRIRAGGSFPGRSPTATIRSFIEGLRARGTDTIIGREATMEKVWTCSSKHS